jgi:hypothetical protein
MPSPRKVRIQFEMMYFSAVVRMRRIAITPGLMFKADHLPVAEAQHNRTQNVGIGRSWSNDC